MDRRAPSVDAPSCRRAGILAAIVVGMGAFYLLDSAGAAIRQFPDTEFYLNLAAKPLRIPDIFFDLRPFAFIVFLKALGSSPRLVVTVQTLLYFGAWTFLAYALLFHVRHLFVAAALAVFVGIVALYPEFASWNLTLLSEPLSIALVVIAVAALMLWISTRRTAYLVLWVVSLAASVHVRDVNAYYSLCFVLLLPFFWLMRLMGARAAAVVGLLLVGNFAFAIASSNHAGTLVSDPRWYFAMLTNVGRRILPDPEFHRFFVEHGMPDTPAVRSMSGKWPQDDDWAFYRRPDLEDFRQWLAHDGQRVYSRFLASHPGYVVSSLAADAGEVFQHREYVLGYYLPDHYMPRSPIRIEHGYLYVGNLLLLAALVVVGARAGATRQLRLLEAGFALVFLLALGPLAFFCFHSSPMEIARHSLPVPLHNVLAFLMGAFLLFRVRPEPTAEPG